MRIYGQEDESHCAQLGRPVRRWSWVPASVALCLTGCGAPDEVAPASKVSGLVVCPVGETVAGIDVSYWQGSIDWASVADGGVAFAFIRVSDGPRFVDPDFAANWAGAREAGVLRGAYQFFRADEDAEAQANLLLDTMGSLEANDLPPVIDLETTEDLTGDEIAQQVGLWIDVVEAAIGRAPIIYTGRYFWNNQVVSDAFASYPLWIPNWEVDCPNIPDAWTEWIFWQTSASGTVAGISERTDLDLFNGSLADLEVFARGSSECGDGTCSRDESVDGCPGDCPPCGIVAAQGGIVDDEDPCFVAGGPSEYIRPEADGWDGSLKWTHATDNADEINFGHWTLFFAEAGRYLVEVYTDASFAESVQSTYRIAHAGAIDDLPIDQTAVDGWQLLGELDFAAGDSQSVHLADNTGEAIDVQIVLDAIRLTRVDVDPGEDASMPDGGDTPPDAGQDAMGSEDAGGEVEKPSGTGVSAGCGCHTSPRAPSAEWLLAFAVLLVRLRSPRS